MFPRIIAVTVQYYSGCTQNIFSSSARTTLYYNDVVCPTHCNYMSIYIHTVYYADITEQSHNDTTRLDEWNTKILHHNMYRLQIGSYNKYKVMYIIIYYYSVALDRQRGAILWLYSINVHKII